MAEIRSRGYTKFGANEHDRIFGPMKPIDYSGKEELEVKKDESIKTVDPTGRPITLNARQKNKIYAKAKHLKEEIRNGLCTTKECWNPTEANVNKMTKEIKMADEINKFKNMMKLQGAAPKEYGTERLRRRGW